MPRGKFEKKYANGTSIMPRKKNGNTKPLLTKRYLQFAECYVTTGNKIGCALQVNVPYTKIDEFINSPGIQLAIETVRARNINKDAGMDKQYLLAHLRTVIDSKDNTESDKLRAVSQASDLLGLTNGDVENIPATTEDAINYIINSLALFYNKKAEDIKAFLKNKDIKENDVSPDSPNRDN